MQRQSLRSALVTCLAALAACATRPDVAPVSGSESRLPAAAAPPAVNTAYLAKGYRMRVRGKTVLYCRSETPTASNIRSEVCLTEQQLQREAATTRAVVEAMQQYPGARTPSARGRY